MTAKPALYPSLEGKTVLITGGAEGIGAATAELFARQGSKVLILDIATTSAQATITHITDLAPIAGYPTIHAPIFYHSDLSDLESLQQTAAQILSEHGPVHILINNAAAGARTQRTRIEDVTASSWDASINVNLRHIYFLTQAVLPGMKAARQGSIVNMGSITWRVPSDDSSVYAACKAAIMGLTRVLSKEVGGFNVRVNSVMPGAIATKRQVEEVLTDEYRTQIWNAQSLKRDLLPVDVAKVVVFLASDEASGVTGSSYVVDGGWCSDP